MKQKLKTLIYGDASECRAADEMLKKMQPAFYRHECKYSSEWEDFREQLVQWDPGLVIIIWNGAVGMEGAYLVRNQRPELPIFWFSDDDAFSIQSHRLDCNYFSIKPITPEKFQKAFQRCAHVGTRFRTVRPFSRR